MGIIGEMKRDKSLGSSSSSTTSSGNRSGSSLLGDRPRPLSAFWGGLGSKSSSSPKSEPVVPKGYKLKHSYGGSTGHLDAYAGGLGGGMRPAVSMPVVAGAHLPVASPSSRNNASNAVSGSNNINSSSKHRHQQHRNSLPPALIQHPSLQQRSNQQRPPSRAISTTTINSGLTSRMVKNKKNQHTQIKTNKIKGGGGVKNRGEQKELLPVCADFKRAEIVDDQSVNVT